MPRIIGFANETIEYPCATTTLNEHAMWEQCIDMVMSWIINSMDSELVDSKIASSIIHVEKASEVWEKLVERGFCKVMPLESIKFITPLLLWLKNNS